MKAIMAGGIFLALGLATACNSSSTAGKGGANNKSQLDTTRYTTVQWIDSLVNLGPITAGEKKEVKFRFKNTGEYPLIIANVAAGCGCTVPSYTKEPVAPGEEGVVNAAFNSQMQSGNIRKNIVVTANTKPKQQFELVFTGEIKEVK